MNPEDVSVVVQGPLGPYSSEVLSAVRQFLPGAELILSTWQGAEIGQLDVDELVLSEDPGSVPYWPGTHRLFNTVRLQRSTRNGVLASSRPWVLKLRTDTPMTSSAVLSWEDRYPARSPELRVFGERVLTSVIATRPSRHMPGYLFHPSDCVHFGRAADLVQLWDGPESDERGNAAYWLPGGAGRGENPGSRGPALWNEQLVWLGALRRAGHEISYPYYGFTAPGLDEVSDLSIVNNFVVLEPWQLGVAMPKLQALARGSGVDSYLWHEDWLELYDHHCLAAGAGS